MKTFWTIQRSRDATTTGYNTLDAAKAAAAKLAVEDPSQAFTVMQAITTAQVSRVTWSDAVDGCADEVVSGTTVAIAAAEPSQISPAKDMLTLEKMSENNTGGLGGGMVSRDLQTLRGAGRAAPVGKVFVPK